MKTKVALLDPNFGSDPIAASLSEAGFEVLRIGKHFGFRDSEISESYLDMDYSRPDLEKVLQEIGNLAFVVPGCTDQSLLAVANLRLGQTKNVPNYSQLVDKAKFARLAARLDLPVPRTVQKTDLVKQEGWNFGKVLLKPRLGHSGQGIELVSSPEAENFLSNNPDYLGQEFIAGDLHSGSAIVRGNHVEAVTFVREYCLTNPYRVDLSFVTPQLPPHLETQFKLHILQIAEEISLHEGLLHSQFILKDEQLFFLEVTARMPGDLYPVLVTTTSNPDYINGYLRGFGVPAQNTRRTPLFDGFALRITRSIQPGQRAIDLLPLESGTIIRSVYRVPPENVNQSTSPLPAQVLIVGFPDVKQFTEEIKRQKETLAEGS